MGDGQKSVLATMIGVDAVVAKAPFTIIAVITRPETIISKGPTSITEVALT